MFDATIHVHKYIWVYNTSTINTINLVTRYSMINDQRRETKEENIAPTSYGFSDDPCCQQTTFLSHRPLWPFHHTASLEGENLTSGGVPGATWHGSGARSTPSEIKKNPGLWGRQQTLHKLTQRQSRGPPERIPHINWSKRPCACVTYGK